MKDTRAEVGPVQRPEVPPMPTMYAVMKFKLESWWHHGTYSMREDAEMSAKQLVYGGVPCRLITIPGDKP